MLRCVNRNRTLKLRAQNFLHFLKNNLIRDEIQKYYVLSVFDHQIN